MKPCNTHWMKDIICLLGLFVASTVSAQAVPVFFGDHYYQFVEVADPFTGENNAWWTARDAAAASTNLGYIGHLATITSKAENDFLYDLVEGQYSSGFTGAWLGGKAPEGWLVGPEAGQGFGYTAWGGIEPNNQGYAYMNIGTPYSGIGPSDWADDGGVNGLPEQPGDPVVGYFVEYDIELCCLPDERCLEVLIGDCERLGGIRVLDCGSCPTPTEDRTWGSVKALYR